MENNFCEIDNEVIIGNNVVFEPFCVIKGKTIIGDNCIIKSYSKIISSIIGSDNIIESSHIENSKIGNNCIIGPFAKIKANSNILNSVTIGNFVEVKNSKINSNSKIKHLSYLGDCEIGENCNIGCSVVFANYDGKNKFRSLVGNNVFIGCNSVLIAPVEIKDNCYICAGTILDKNLNEDDFVIGRSYAQIKPNKAHKYLKNFIKKD